MSKRNTRRPEETAEDVLHLQDMSEDVILQNIKERYAMNQIYTHVGSSIVLSVNPCKIIDSSSDTTLLRYKEWAESTSAEKKTLPAHVFDLGSSAFYHMTRGKEDQCILLNGESGSGKTETGKLLIRHIVALSKQSTKKKLKAVASANLIDTVFNAFGSAMLNACPNSSRFGRYTELQFDRHGHLIGLKVLDYLLEKHRVTHVLYEDRNFNIFYYLLAGATTEERVRFLLNDIPFYKYMNTSKYTKPAPEDSIYFEQLRQDMKDLGIGRRQQAQIFQLLSAILHIGNIEFIDDPDHPQEACTVKNYDQLQVVAELLGVIPENLEITLTYKTKYIKNELCTIYLNAAEAGEQRDAFATTLYSLVFKWIIEHINNRLCKDDFDNFIGIVDLPGFQDHRSNQLEVLLYNYSAEKMHEYVNYRIIDEPYEEQVATGLRGATPTPYEKNDASLKAMDDRQAPTCLFEIIDKEAVKGGRKADQKIKDGIFFNFKDNKNVFPIDSNNSCFGVRHFLGTVEYDNKTFAIKNTENICPDFISIARGDSKDMPASENMFVRDLFSDSLIATQKHSKDAGIVIDAQNATTPTRKPSIRKKSGGRSQDKERQMTWTKNYQASVVELFEILKDTRPWFVFCLKPNGDLLTDKFNARKVKVQLGAHQIATIAAARAKCDYSCSMTFNDFVERFTDIIEPLNIRETSPNRVAREFLNMSNWGENQMALSGTKVYLSELAWKSLDDEARLIKYQRKRQQRKSEIRMSTASQDIRRFAKADDASSYYSSDDNMSYQESDTESTFAYEATSKPLLPQPGEFGSKDLEMNSGSQAQLINKEKEQKQPKKKMSGSRKRWLCCTWCLTWWIPGPFLSWCGGMKRADVRTAWREKVALCILIFLISAFFIFFIIVLGNIICPLKAIYSTFELEGKRSLSDPWVYMYGRAYKINGLIDNHNSFYEIDRSTFGQLLGKDVSDLFFKRSSWGYYCPGVREPTNANWDNVRSRRPESSFNGIYYHRAVIEKNGQAFNKRYIENMNQYAKARIAHDWEEISKSIGKDKHIVVIKNNVYDVTSYFDDPSRFLGPSFDRILGNDYRGKDATALYERLAAQDRTMAASLNCMNNMFYIGVIDDRASIQCKLSNYILLSASLVIVAVILFKFLAALRFGTNDDPEEHDKFVICQVPCYTEGPEGLSRTLDSLALTRYDDKRKLLFVICDGKFFISLYKGMIIGSGNDRPTPRIVLDLLGVDGSVDPEPKAFQSLGEGDKQHNFAKIYSGLYQLRGHSVPFIVLVKVGKTTERQRPGNRGKRDSQLVLMRFLSRVHFNAEMCPMELEIYHHMKNIIGVNPSFYEYILMVDADTEVMVDSLNKLVSTMIQDSKIIGLCGETLLANEKDSVITMIQVYEYFISHHLSKAFESLFGTVTCLPGCFSMYRVRTPNKNVPLLTAPALIADYSENEVDTLHLKNLLHLGEDRYLTTLMMKHFPDYRLSFTAEAQCRTNAPDRWSVLLSQRRRWINSTVHNLFELLCIPGLCGFCCFSLRFIVFLDLFSTVVQPAAMLYIIYLVYALITTYENQRLFPIVSVVMIAAVYALQIIIFIFKKQWGQIIWMIIYILAMPLFGFYIPVYSFWHFDDFSWGNTRVVVGEKGKVIQVGFQPFDPTVIPMMKWAEYEKTIGNDWEQYQFEPSVGPGSVYGGSNAGGTEVSYAMSAAGYPQTMSMPPMPMMEPMPPRYSNPNRMSMLSYSSQAMIPDDDIIREIRAILGRSNLMTITKKQVREELSAIFGVDLSFRKNDINEKIDAVLQGRL